ncbi:MAG: acetoacetate decarboxylase family protein, partial [Gaiellales bacterium]
FRGLLMKSYIYFRGHVGAQLLRKGSARLTIGDHPRVQPLKRLEIAPNPLVTAFIPDAVGVLDDYFESWFLSHDSRPTAAPEGLESVADLGLGEEWPAPPVTAP